MCYPKPYTLNPSLQGLNCFEGLGISWAWSQWWLRAVRCCGTLSARFLGVGLGFRVDRFCKAEGVNFCFLDISRTCSLSLAILRTSIWGFEVTVNANFTLWGLKGFSFTKVGRVTP